jgi:hypothetical protein
MRHTILVNAVWYLVIAFVWLGHVTFVVPHVPDNLALPLNIGLVPFLIGCAAQLLFRASLLVKLILVATLPVVHVLVFGGDPAKPGVEHYVALAVGAVMLTGMLLGFALSKLVLRRTAPP